MDKIENLLKTKNLKYDIELIAKISDQDIDLLKINIENYFTIKDNMEARSIIEDEDHSLYGPTIEISVYYEESIKEYTIHLFYDRDTEKLVEVLIKEKY